jgi:hypothetical protein
VLPGTEILESPHDAGCHVDGPLLVVLGRPDRRDHRAIAAAVHVALAADVDPAVREVDVHPLQVQRLLAAHAAGGDVMTRIRIFGSACSRTSSISSGVKTSTCLRSRVRSRQPRDVVGRQRRDRRLVAEERQQNRERVAQTVRRGAPPLGAKLCVGNRPFPDRPTRTDSESAPPVLSSSLVRPACDRDTEKSKSRGSGRVHTSVPASKSRT